MYRRTVLLGAAAALPGCGAVPWRQPDTPTSDGAPVEAGDGEYAHSILVHNDLDVAEAVTLAVERGDGVLYEGTHRVGPGRRTVVAGFTVATFPEGRRYVTVSARTPGGAAASVGVSVTPCLGDVLVVIDEAGPEVTYSTC